MGAQELKRKFNKSFQAALALVPGEGTRLQIDLLHEMVELAVIRSRRALDKPIVHELMIDLLGLYINAVEGVRGPSGKYHDTQVVHALFAPLRDTDKGRELNEKEVRRFIKDMRDECGLQRFLLAETPKLRNRLQNVRLVHH